MRLGETKITVSIGDVFERLSVIGGPTKKGGKNYWRCMCVCGTVKDVAHSSLVSGAVRSCQCLMRELAAARKSQLKHGYAAPGKVTPEYRIWVGIIKRCCNSSNHSFADYGGRGITVCEKWRHDFPAFLADMGKRPSAAHSIERKDNDGPYSPG
jgi:hypothetical protein